MTYHVKVNGRTVYSDRDGENCATWAESRFINDHRIQNIKVVGDNGFPFHDAKGRAYIWERRV